MDLVRAREQRQKRHTKKNGAIGALRVHRRNNAIY